MPTIRPHHRSRWSGLCTGLVAGLVSGLVLTGCGFGDPPRQPSTGRVTIGLLTGGVDSPPGLDAVRGAQLAVDLINEARSEIALPLAAGTGLPGLDGVRLSLAVADTEGVPEAADGAMDELLSQGAVAVVAADRAAVVEIAGAYADRRQLPLVDGATTAGYLLDIGLDWYFRTGPTDRMLSEATLTVLPAPEPSQAEHRVTVLTPADGRGADVARQLAEQATAAGLEVTGTLTAGDRLIEQLTLDPPDILVAVAPAPADGAALHRAVAGWSDPRALVVGLGQGFATDPRDRMPAGMVHAAAWSADLAQRQPLARAVADRYQATFEAPMTEAAAQAFTATMILAMATDAAGSREPASIRAALRQLSIPATQTIMPWDGVRFGDTGQNELAAAVAEQVHRDGGAQVVFPPELAEVDLVWDRPEPAPPPL